ncbi:MAG: glycosyltransferase [Candidatus Buchananbacteria bacterium]
MRVCYFGIYKPTYTRNLTLIGGLRENNIEVIECNTREKSNKKYFQLLKAYWPIRKNYDVMVVGFPGHTIMPLAWFLAKMSGKKIVFDAFVSMYDSVILDRAQYLPKSLMAKKYWAIDWLACKLADMILLDADEHIKFFIETFKIKKEKFKRILVSCDDKLIFPRQVEKEDKNFLVHFHGTYIPIQGVKYIIAAARILKNEDIKFNIVGRLKDYQPEIEKVKEWQLANINFIDFLPYEKLAEMIAKADVCLGMFGKTPKAFRCGAFKITESMAAKIATITGDTPAMREFLEDKKSCLFCKMADANDLAAKILELKNNSDLKEQIADGGYQVYLKLLTPKATAGELISVLNLLISKK